MIGSSSMKGKSSALFNILAMSRSSFLVMSPACSDGVVVDGGAVSIVMISVVACLRKLSSLSSRYGMTVGKNFRVSQSRSLLVFVK